MPTQESAVMDKTKTGNVKATATHAPRKKAVKLNPAEIRAQIKQERAELANLKGELKDQKAELRDTLKESKANVLEATKALKAVTSVHAKAVKDDEKNIAACEKAVTKQQGVIDKLTAKLG